MTWNEILILLIMVMGLFAIDMLVAKFNLKAGRIVAVLTFFILFPLGLIAGVVALICMNSKGKQRKFSIIAFCKNVLFHAFLLGIILLYLIDMILLKIFPDATFPVVFLSICFSPVVIVFVAKALDCLRDIKRKPKKADVTTKNRVNEPFIVNEKKEAAPTVALQKTDEGDSEKIKPDKPIEKASAPIQKAQDDNKVEETMSQAENKPMVNTDNTKPNEKLVFYDEGKKFIKQEHSLYNLTGDCDICVYSLTPKGETSPKWLIVKVTQAGCMDRYLDDKAKVPKRCVAMVRMDYEEISPRSLFNITRDLTLLLRQNIKKTIEFRFYEDDGLRPRRIDLNDFFSIEVDSESNEPGAEIYLRDKEYFLNSDKKTKVTEPQTSVETIANTKKSESVNGKYVNHTSSTKKTPETAPTAKKSVDKCSNTLVTEASPAKATKMEELIELVIPEGTAEIRAYEFKNRDDIISVVIPDGVVEIGVSAFCGCKNLESVKLPRDVKIKDSAFRDCKKLKTISNLWRAKEIRETAFSGCDSIDQNHLQDLGRIISTSLSWEEMEQRGIDYRWPDKDYDSSYDPYGPRNWH